MAKTKMAKCKNGIGQELVLPAGTRFAKLAIGCMVVRPGLTALIIDFDDGLVVELDETELMPGSTLDELTTRTSSAVAEFWSRSR